MSEYIIRDNLNRNIILNNGKIEKIINSNNKKIDFDATNYHIFPGFIDIHTHGADGIDVNSADIDGLKKISAFFAKQGVTGWLCSILTDTKEQTINQIKVARKFIEEIQREDFKGVYKDGAKLLGIHLEGPCLSVEYKGAMPEHLLMKKADIEIFKQYQQIAGGYIKYVTIAPEIENAIDIIPELNDMGITVSIGHSCAGYDIASKAIEAGAKAATHLGNAERLFHQHDPAIWGVALEKDCYVEAICDGLHLHPGTVRLYLKAAGWDKVIAITDSIMATGLPDGNYKLGVNDVTVIDGDAKLSSTGVRAGSTLTLIKAMKNICEFTKQSPEKVSNLMTINPAKLMGFNNKGEIKENMDADIVIVDNDLEVVMTIVGGNVVYRNDKIEA